MKNCVECHLFRSYLQKTVLMWLRDLSSANQFEQNSNVYNTMNHFLRSFLDHVTSQGNETSHRTIMCIMLVFIPDTCSLQACCEMEYIVKDKQWFETHFGVEAGDITVFYNSNNPKELRGVTSNVSTLCISLWISPYR